MTTCSDLAALLRDDDVSEVEMDWESLIDSVERSADILACTRHPLGFLHVELTPMVPLLPGERLRLHYWPNVGADPDALGSLHDHVWHLASVVAAGRLQDRTLRPVPDNEGDYEGVRVEYSTPANHFRPAGRFSLRLQRELTVGPNSIYRVPSRVVHDSSVLEAPAVTFVLARDDDNAESLGPLILQRRGGEQSGTAVRSSFSVATALQLVRKRLHP